MAFHQRPDCVTLAASRRKEGVRFSLLYLLVLPFSSNRDAIVPLLFLYMIICINFILILLNLSVQNFGQHWSFFYKIDFDTIACVKDFV